MPRRFGAKNLTREVSDIRVLTGLSSTPGGTTDHGSLLGLDDDDHAWAVHISSPRTITAQHAFSPLSAQAPFALGANAQNQLVTGLLADSANNVNRSIVAGAGLTGGGALTADRTLNVGAGDGITVNADSIEVRLSSPANPGMYFDGGGLKIGAGVGITVDPASVKIDQAFSPTWTGLHTFNRAVAPFAIGPLGTDLLVSGLNADKADGYDFNQDVRTTGTPSFASIAIGTNVLLANTVAGRVGVNMSPSYAFDVTGSARIDDTTFFVDSINHRVGIKTIGPAVELEVVGQAYIRNGIGVYDGARITNLNSSGWVQFNTGGTISIADATGAEMARFSTVAAEQFRLAYDASNYTTFRVGATGNLTITPNGSGSMIGIGTSPSAKLHVLRTTEQLRLGYDASNYSSFTVGAGGNLTVAPTGDWIFDPAGNDVMPGNNYDINLGSPIKKYLSLYAAELIVDTLVSQYVMATIGGRVMVTPTTNLTEDLPAASTSLVVELNPFVAGDILFMEKEGHFEAISVTSGPTGTGPYTYVVVRNLDGTGANDWIKGDAIVKTKFFIDLYSTQGILSGSGPAIAGSMRNTSTWNDISTVWAIGNLNGIYGYGADTMGIGLGKYTATTNYLTIDPTSGLRFYGNNQLQAQFSGSDLTFYANAIQSIKLDGVTGDAIFGIQAASKANLIWDASEGDLMLRINAGVGLWFDGSAGKFTIGGDATDVTKTALAVFGAAQTYNSESMGANDLLIGDNSSSKANILWDRSAGEILLRGGTTMQVKIDTAGKILAGAGAVWLDSNGLSINYGTADASAIKWYDGATEVAHIDYAIRETPEVVKMSIWARALSSQGSVIELEARNSSGGGAQSLRLTETKAYLSAGLTINNGLALGYTNSTTAKSKVLLINEGGDPGTLTSGTEAAVYVIGDKLVLAFNDGGTMRYKYLLLSGTGVTWVHTTTAPT